MTRHHHRRHGHGHNGHRGPSQWQTPHLPDHEHETSAEEGHEPDLDLVEAAFIDGFSACADPTSFLRLAGVALAGRAADGRVLKLLRVEIGDTRDIGSLTPLLDGGGFRYAPLPARLVGRRRSLAFAYHDGADVVRLTFGEARRLAGNLPDK